MPKISVIMPVYNVAAYLPKCLDSIINQTFNDLEIICINDCSTDNSLQILKEYEKKDKRIKVIANKENVGAALTRNVGIDMAKGEYIYFMDSDDWLETDYLAVMLQTIEQVNTDIILNLNIIQETPEISKPYEYAANVKISPQGEYWDKWRIITDSPCLLWARLYRREFLEKNHLRLSPMRTTCDDYIFQYTSNLYCEKTFLFYGSTYHYRVHNNSITGIAKTNKCWDLQFMKAYDAIYDYYKEHNVLDDCPIKIFNMMSFFAVDTKEKFDFYRAYFAKAADYFTTHENLYNALENYFRLSLLESNDFEQYRTKHSSNILAAYLRNKRK